ncbi:MAG: formyltetrahydrofolate deformylase [Chloroflexi bacterium]|uniref:Formyltetrahydrofolate deformylase n=1 Tax=Candidatus Chlorohelix allophototropha TaxID=3003348 RepID=A0A8T7M9F1_9CHLR|nr:formyltetrahydrofolate deformylase [Chloroflexota bacterium]WJW68586.1 formyltetrahydrofolate deformylase [Chloroflexota bacterium L227-S17]
MSNHYILTLSCHDIAGIVAAVAGFLTENDGFIIESAQFGDPSTGRFFMRTEFVLGEYSCGFAALKQKFGVGVAHHFSMEWQLADTSIKPRVVILVSKYRHCLNDLLHRYSTGALPIEIPCVISNHDDLRELCTWYKIPFIYIPVVNGDKLAQEAKVWEHLEQAQAEVVVLARYMQVLSPGLVSKMAGRCINIHHSFLPSFKGARPYHQAYDRGVKLIGATAHYVTNALDEGPIIEQEVVRVDHSNSPEALVAVGRDSECLVLARALKYHIEHRVLVNGNKTVVFR